MTKVHTNLNSDDFRNKIELDVLPRVRKPARYAGGEVNAVVGREADLRLALCFPEVYEIGMSNHGFLLLYHMVNELPGMSCERCFAPWPDMEKALRDEKLPLYSLETFTPLSDFDVIGMSLSYEMTYTNVLTMLDLGGLPVKSSERNESHPLVIAGGGCAVNPEPMADFIDAFVIGEGEEALTDVLKIALDAKKSRLPRADLLAKLSAVPGLYVPSLYNTSTNEIGMTCVTPGENAKLPIKRLYVSNLAESFFPETCIVPSVEAVHDRINLELFRGCARGCRYCQAGMIYRPRRERPPELLAAAAKKHYERMGCDNISLLSLNATDYTGMGQLLESLLEFATPQRVSISMPSTRVDSMSADVVEKLLRVRSSGLTIAPEAGTQRLRNVINKQITDQDIERAVRESFSAGSKKIKLYFMIGLPTETMEDVDGIAAMVRKLEAIAREYKGRIRGKTDFTLSVANFVPKPHTPFQWDAMNTTEELAAKRSRLRDLLRGNNIKLDFHDLERSRLEAVFSRGDRRLGATLEAAWKLGARMDGWSEMFNLSAWNSAFAECGIDPDIYSNTEYPLDSPLPWGHISSGIKDGYMRRERERALAAESTRDCVTGPCSGCGLACRQDGQ